MTTRRAYDNALRTERAAQTRARVLEAAAETFTAHGWAGATVAQIAACAGVSVDSVGATGPKGVLLLEAFRRRYTGEDGWASILELERTRVLFSIEDPVEALDAIVDFLWNAHGASARLWLLLRTVALTEPVVAEGMAELQRLKTESFTDTTRWLQRLDLVADVADEGVAQLVAEVNLVMSAETWLQLVDDYGWSEEQYGAWVRRSITALR
jgi:hypothetical protein